MVLNDSSRNRRENNSNSWMFEKDENGYILPAIKSEPESWKSLCGENLKRKRKNFLAYFISNMMRGLQKNN